MGQTGKPMTDKRVKFAHEYAKDLNGTAAALRAGYAKGSAHVTSSRLLRDPTVAALIESILARANAKAQITVERTQQEIARIAYGDMRRLFDKDHRLRDITELSEEEAAMIGGVESVEEYAGQGEKREAVGMVRKVKLRDKLGALEKCMSILGMHKTAAPPDGGSLNITIHMSTDEPVRRRG